MQNIPNKKLFVCEFITGGGLNHSDLPQELAEQGLLMRDALLYDLSTLPYHIHTTVDARLAAPVDCDYVQMIHAEHDAWLVWESAMREADVVWLIAPETDGYLLRMTALALKHKKVIIGSGVNSISICSSKLATYQQLKQAQITTVETVDYSEWNQQNAQKWLAKPDDGAGCEETVCFNSAAELVQWMQQGERVDTHIIQPFLTGIPASISCVMHRGKVFMLSCNQQMIEMDTHYLTYKGCLVNGMRRHWTDFEVLANKIAKAFPDLAGYVGIDVMVNDADPTKITVVEINPRLTTSYVALREATGHNPAELITNTMMQENRTWPKLQQNEVLLAVSGCHA